MEAEYVNSGSGGGLFVVFLFVALLAIALMVTQAPSVTRLELPQVKDIQYQTHAVESHGDDALWARESVQQCKPKDLRVNVCPRSIYGLTVAFWCEPVGKYLCGGIYTTISGVEKTAFVRPCEQWRKCK
jgi:hypothetical protein